MLTRRKFMAAAALTATGPALLARPAYAMKSKIFTKNGLAIRGIDPVAYFTAGAPTMGVGDHSSEWNGATWQFASAENKALFDGDPEAYAPKYGGYCAYAVSKGSTASTDPEAWTIHENRLYLNFSTTVRGIWSEDIPGNVAKADANWPGVLA